MWTFRARASSVTAAAVSAGMPHQARAGRRAEQPAHSAGIWPLGVIPPRRTGSNGARHGRWWSQVVAVALGVAANVVAVWSQSADPTAVGNLVTGPLTSRFGGAPRGIRTPNRQIRSLVLSVDLVGSRRIWPAHVGCLVDRVGSRRVPSDRLDDQTDDQARPAARPPDRRRPRLGR